MSPITRAQSLALAARSVRSACLSVLLLTAASSPLAQAAEDDPILQVYRRSGMQEQLREYPKNLETLLSTKRDEIAPRVFQAMQRGLREAGDSIDMDSTFLVRLRSQMSTTTTHSVLKFLGSPTGKTVTEAERRSNTPEGIAGFDRFIKEQGPGQGEQARARLFRVLDAAVGSSDLMTHEILAMNHAVAVAFDAARPPGERQGAEMLWTLVRQGEPQVRSEAQQRILASYFYIYRAISKEELRQYIQFLTSEEALDYHRVFLQLLIQSLAEFDAVMARVIAREMLSE